MRISAVDGSSDNLTATESYDGGVIIQEPDIFATTGPVEATEFQPISVEIVTNRYKETARADVTGLWPDGEVPETDEIIRININGQRTFTGWIDKVNEKGDGSVEVVAYDLVKKLLRLKISKTFNDVPLSVIAETVANLLDEADLDLDYQLPESMTVSPEYENTPGTQILDQVAKWGDVVWWVDAYDNIHIKPPEPTEFEIGAEFIKEGPTAGGKAPPYRSAVAMGESPASQSSGESSVGGHRTAHMLSKRPVVASSGEGEPTYTYQSKQIRTHSQAQNAANAIVKEFQRQRADGNVTIVGEGIPIRPFDVIEMPDQLGNERYLVSGIKHTFTNSDGLIHDINCGGLIDGQ